MQTQSVQFWCQPVVTEDHEWAREMVRVYASDGRAYVFSYMAKDFLSDSHLVWPVVYDRLMMQLASYKARFA